ncbi:DUF1684 domain-containing protein [Modestobacter versicolor]|uniref:DUF1684 domain-containing protein n=1 Tax=Modestobacter versicolor TaxID=429133 RepID=A0A323V5T4_9ACTN|nr:DUF1684 domain-containing protein [Modestobacter versicolor]MBB3675010.1 hypothetical protein [Modestobacter versicolor]PZA19861.1 hypothetical protein DMO24_18465 [Modestobacter versicolor]
MSLTDTDTFAADWADWHAQHEAARADRHGFLAITGLHWLTGEPQRLDGAPGEWWTGADGPVVRLADGEELVVDGQPVHGEHAFGVIPERGGVTVGYGDAVIEVARRGGSDVVRPRHPSNPVLVGYPGTPAYPADPRWALTGRYVPFDEPRPTTVGAVVEGLQHVYDAPGRIEFTLDGQQLALTAFNGSTPGSLFVLFTDETSGVTTYAANRSVQVAPPAADGTVTLDLNRATNLPCAYTAFATCPLPPAENHLPVAVEAGEKKPVG